jgi:hypothetical protein
MRDLTYLVQVYNCFVKDNNYTGTISSCLIEVINYLKFFIPFRISSELQPYIEILF